MSFPYHAVPDGNVALPHHLYTGALLALLMVAVVWDDYPAREPLAAALGLLLALLCFALIWPEYPVIGAAGTLVGLGVSTLGLLRPTITESGLAVWWLQHYPTWAWVLALLFLFIAWDDAIQHALGWTTPLDHLWRVDGIGLKELTPSH